jgi:heme-degrading monooxygenase HmoA
VAARYTYLWEFLIEPERLEEFQRHYGPRGTWVGLFRQSPGYLETLLLQDAREPRRFITIDRWESEEAYQSFRARFAREYAELDARCQHFTTRETSLGQYSEASA